MQEAQEKEAVTHSDTSASRSSKRAKQAHNPNEEFVDQGINEDPSPSHSSHSEPPRCCICGKENKWVGTNPKRRDDVKSIRDTDGNIRKYMCVFFLGKILILLVCIFQ